MQCLTVVINLLDIFCEKVAEQHHFYTAPPPGKNFKRIFNFVLPVHFEAYSIRPASGSIKKKYMDPDTEGQNLQIRRILIQLPNKAI
jgi:hypothetical protein